MDGTPTRATREPTSLLPLRWGGYRERYLGGLCLIVGGGVAIAGSDTYVLWLLWPARIAHVAGWCILPVRGLAAVVVVLPSTLSMWLLLPGPRYLVVLVIPYLGWLLVRHRPALAYPTAIFVLAGRDPARAGVLGVPRHARGARRSHSRSWSASAWVARAVAVRETASS